MMIDISRLKETVVTKNTTMEALAYDLGINRSTLYRKLRRGSAGITLQDADTIAKTLELTPLESRLIFGGCYVPRM